jgi:uncharacterized phage protein (TIGR01671 family)
MREIKFRAWYKSVERMQYFQGIKWMLSYNGEEKLIIGDDFHDDYYDSEIVPEDFELMQYTGLKDKNNKEIYEGDIINQTTATGTDGHIEQVIFLLGIFGTQSKGRGFNNLNNWTNEVIGNIYENPELVNERNSN